MKSVVKNMITRGLVDLVNLYFTGYLFGFLEFFEFGCTFLTPLEAFRHQGKEDIYRLNGIRTLSLGTAQVRLSARPPLQTWVSQRIHKEFIVKSAKKASIFSVRGRSLSM